MEDGMLAALETRTHYFGKYRGTVVDNVDPLKRGRLRVTGAGGARRGRGLGDAVRAVRGAEPRLLRDA